MSIRKTNFVEGECYHVYNRGNSKQKIFHDKQDYYYLIDLLYIANTDQDFNLRDLKRNLDLNLYEIDRKNNLVDIGSYCLMPNHFHILINEKTNGGISKFMQRLGTAYAMYYNNKYKRKGSLFEGKFKSKYVDNDVYLKYLFSYIHLNPIKLIDKKWKEDGIKNKINSINFLNKYQYSSYLDFLGHNRRQNKIINKKSFPDYFPDNKDFIKEIFNWFNYKSLYTSLA